MRDAPIATAMNARADPRVLQTLGMAGVALTLWQSVQYGPIDVDGGAQSLHQMPRGALWPGGELAGIVHRSPPASDGALRLLLVIDPVDDWGRC